MKLNNKRNNGAICAVVPEVAVNNDCNRCKLEVSLVGVLPLPLFLYKKINEVEF
jgi:hypothetical protein